jgi:hypothetical protein
MSQPSSQQNLETQPMESINVRGYLSTCLSGVLLQAYSNTQNFASCFRNKMKWRAMLRNQFLIISIGLLFNSHFCVPFSNIYERFKR